MIRSLLGHLFDFVYWVAVIIGLVLLSPVFDSTALLIASLAVYIAVAIAGYFLILRRIKRHLGE